MPRLRVALTTVAIAALAAACGSSSSTVASPPSSSQAPSNPPSAAPTAAPSISALPSASASSGPAVSLTEWKVAVSGTIKSGKTDLKISDVGAAPHELLVFKSDLDPSAYPTDKAGDIVEDGPGIKLLSDGDNIDPGAAQTRTVDLAPGKYLFVCNIPGHFKQGMFTVVTVAP
jgi:Copper binding proteins, plastocyanin/azurin family